MLNQLLTIAQHRIERYQGSFSIAILEVARERLCDLCAGTHTVLACGKAQGGGNCLRNGRGQHSAVDKVLAGFLRNASARGGSKLNIRKRYDSNRVD